MGNEYTYFESESCGFQGLDKIYTYNNITIKTYPDNSIDKILSIKLNNDSVYTFEKVKIGDSYENVIRVYGDAFSEYTNGIKYQQTNMSLIFIFENDIVVSIEYVYNI